MTEEQKAWKKTRIGDTEYFDRKQFMRDTAAKWSDMKDKSKYEAKAKKDAERYDKEMTIYNQEGQKINLGNLCRLRSSRMRMTIIRLFFE
jgi:hypothetical protein